MDELSPTVASLSVPFVIGYFGEGAYDLPYGLGMDPIIHRNPEPGVWLNITEPGHRFYPGSVVHGLYESGGQMWLYTMGVGVGQNPALNIELGHSIFGGMHSDVQRSVTHYPWD